MFNGCLLLEKVSYSITMNEKGSGNALLTVYNLRSDAIGNREFTEDTTQLFTYYLSSQRFMDSMAYYGKNVTQRKLVPEGNNLNAVLGFSFTDITTVEQIQHEAGLYYLTLQTDDSVVTTNGKIVVTDEYKRIIWPETEKKLEFTIAAGNFNPAARGLAPYYQRRGM